MLLSLNTAYDLQLAFKDKIRKSRKATGWSREQFAEMSGVPASTIKRFETCGEISFRQFLMIYEALEGLSELEALTKDKTARPKTIQDVLNAQ